MAQNVDESNGQLPLKGVVLCCTALTQDERIHLADVAGQMGAIHKLDLTADVTHLIVGSISTPKYRYVAKERSDMKVLSPKWVDAVRESWMMGGDVDVESLEMENELPVFHGLHICVTGFDEVDQRNYISSTVEAQGAMYHGDLTKHVTHLIAAAPQGAKYTHAMQWGINVVSAKWFKESLVRGMALDESLYDPRVAASEQGKGAFRHSFQPRTSLGKRGAEEDVQNAATGGLGRKKLRRTISSRLETQSQDMLQDISSRDGSVKHVEIDQWNDDDEAATTHVSESSELPKLKTRTSEIRRESGNQFQSNEPAEGLFSGCYILIQGFLDSKMGHLRSVLRQNGATVVNSAMELENASHSLAFQQRYLLVPHAISSPLADLPEIPTTVMVTEWWVERCIHYKRLLDPAQDVLCAPLWDFEASHFSDLTVSTTGFGGVDLRQVAEAVKLMGATYQEQIISSSSVLISGSTSMRKEKAFYANKHGIPVVSADWLWTCLRQKRKVPFEQHKVSVPAFDPKEFTGDPSTSSPALSDLDQRRPSSNTKTTDESRPKRLSSTRRKQATPSLALQTSKASPAGSKTGPQPFMHEDEDDASLTMEESEPRETKPASSPRGSHPLQELSSNSSAQNKSDACDNSLTLKTVTAQGEGDRAALSRTASPSAPNSPERKALDDSDQHPAIRPQHQLTAEIAEMLSRRTASSEMPQEPPRRRKGGPLGRAASGISIRSNSASASPALPNDTSESGADGYGNAQDAPLPPSTQLGYETAEAEAHRLQMSKKMGMKLHDDSGLKRVASLGTVKDGTFGADGGVGQRTKGRQRR